MPSCSVLNCGNYTGKTKNENIRYYKFPKIETYCARWYLACGRIYLNLKTATVCSRHFDDSAFQKTARQETLDFSPRRLRILKVDAVPTLVIPPGAENRVLSPEELQAIKEYCPGVKESSGRKDKDDGAGVEDNAASDSASEKNSETKSKTKNDNNSSIESNVPEKSNEAESPSDLKEGSVPHKKRRKVVKEILAWIPKDPNAAPPDFINKISDKMPGDKKIVIVPGGTAVPAVNGNESPQAIAISGDKGEPKLFFLPDSALNNLSLNVQKNDTIKKEPNLVKKKTININGEIVSPPLTVTQKTAIVTTTPQPTLKQFLVVAPPTPTTTRMVQRPVSKARPILPDTMRGSSTASVSASASAAVPTPRANNISTTPVRHTSATPVAPTAAPASAKQPMVAAPPPLRKIVKSISVGEGEISSGMALLKSEFVEMRDKIIKLESEVSNYQTQCTSLKAELAAYKKDNAVTVVNKRKEIDLAVHTILSTIFTPGQIRMLLSTGKARINWSARDMKIALALRNISPQAYRYLRTNLRYPFPAPSSIRRFKSLAAKINRKKLGKILDNEQGGEQEDESQEIEEIEDDDIIEGHIIEDPQIIEEAEEIQEES